MKQFIIFYASPFPPELSKDFLPHDTTFGRVYIRHQHVRAMDASDALDQAKPDRYETVLNSIQAPEQ